MGSKIPAAEMKAEDSRFRSPESWPAPAQRDIRNTTSRGRKRLKLPAKQLLFPPIHRNIGKAKRQNRRENQQARERDAPGDSVKNRTERAKDHRFIMVSDGCVRRIQTSGRNFHHL